MQDILNKTSYTANNIIKLAEQYKQLTGKKVCLVCRGEIESMIKELKQHFRMTNFELKGNPIYRVEKGGKIIKNDILTDELALEFLRINPERIQYFSKFPENWEKLLEGEQTEEVEEQLEEVEEKVIEEVEEKCLPCEEKERLSNLTVKEIQKDYPDFEYKVGTKKEDYINQIVDSL